LPQVASETGWDLDTFMGQLCSQKAGLPWNCWQDKDTEIYVFTAQVFD
jgi:AMMECR1 domain-containing protein